MSITNISDLPAELFQTIFNYLADVDIYHLGITGNARLKAISEDYVRLGGKFLLSGGSCFSSEILMVFVRRNKITSTISKKIPRKVHNSAEDTYGGICHKRIILCRGTRVYQYHIKEDKWSDIQVKDDMKHYKSSYNQGCVMNDTIMVCADRERRPADIELLQFSNDNSNNVSNSKPNQPLLQRHLCKTRLPMPIGKCSFRPTIINIDNNILVMLIGSQINRLASSRVFRGEVTEDKRDVRWTELKPMRKRRSYPIVFKMRDSVYVTGGAESEGHEARQCERYDLNKQEWFNSQYYLPYSLWRASVVVSADETFALITGGWSDHNKHSKLGIIIFTEDSGFQKLKNSSLKIARSLHTSLQLPSDNTEKEKHTIETAN